MFGLAVPKVQGSPVHPMDFTFKRPGDYNKQLIAFFEYALKEYGEEAKNFPKYDLYLKVREE